MENLIHPTAIIHPTAVLGQNNYIGPYCVIGQNVTIGDNNRFEAYCSVGMPPEHKKFWNDKYAGVRIGSNCIFREFITIHSGTTHDTILLDNISMLTKSHIGHDAFIDDDVNLSCFSCVGGHSVILKGANLGLHSVVHQNCVVGHYAMLGMGTVVTKKTIIEPCFTYVGNPARKLKLNSIGMKNNNITDEMMKQLQQGFEDELRKIG